MLLYSVSIEFFDPKIVRHQNQWVSNYAKAESFIYRSEKPDTVILGSSLANRLDDSLLGEEIYNLSFSGGSVLSGLEILKRSGNLPKNILIEINIIERSLNKDMVDGLFIPYVWHIKKHLPALQYNYQPINVLLSILKRKVVDPGGFAVKSNKKILERGIERQIERQSTIVFSEYDSQFNQVMNLINYFDKKGVRVIFFRMPVAKSVAETHGYTQRISILNNMFSGKNFTWLTPPNDKKYSTTDGVHLNEKSSNVYTKHLVNCVREFI